MHKLVPAATLALSVLAAACVHADDRTADTPRYYIGAATGLSKSSLENSAGERFSSK